MFAGLNIMSDWRLVPLRFGHISSFIKSSDQFGVRKSWKRVNFLLQHDHNEDSARHCFEGTHGRGLSVGRIEIQNSVPTLSAIFVSFLPKSDKETPGIMFVVSMLIKWVPSGPAGCQEKCFETFSDILIE